MACYDAVPINNNNRWPTGWSDWTDFQQNKFLNVSKPKHSVYAESKKYYADPCASHLFVFGFVSFQKKKKPTNPNLHIRTHSKISIFWNHWGYWNFKYVLLCC
jgi:hypothetical protein